jgi:hypothetical protein
MGKVQMSLADQWRGTHVKHEISSSNGKLSHEAFVHAVAALGVGMLTSEDAATARKAKLTYGAGAGTGARGITYFNRWLNDKAEQAHFVEICAMGESNPVQLAGTTLHELGHVLAGFQAGHGKGWHEACGKLGLRAIRAAGTAYMPAMFHPRIRATIAQLITQLGDGRPMSEIYGSAVPTGKPCSAGIGTRGGKSRGVGSGSRLRKYTCTCGQIIRASTDELDATHNSCGTKFTLAREPAEQ